MFLSEPVRATISIASKIKGMRWIPLASDGTPKPALDAKTKDGRYDLTIPAAAGTHWFLLQAEE